jgi:hypothetical protein
MRIALALAVVATSASAFAQELPAAAKSRVPLLCKQSSERVSGLTKICYYVCARSEGALTVTTYEPCPRWTPRWRLNRTGHFGPSGSTRQ